MKRKQTSWRNLSRYACATGLLFLVACAGPEESGVDNKVVIGSAGYRGMEELDQPLTALATPCSYNTTTNVASITVADGETAVISKRVVDNAILVNGTACGTATSSILKQLDIDGSTGTEVVILDFINGTFATGTSSTVGVVVDLVSGSSDAFKIRGSTGADTFYMGASGISFNADNNVDITLANVDSTVISAGAGNDTITGQGGYGSGTEYTAVMTVYGGAGNDTITGGSGQDVLYGDEGNDTLAGMGDDDTLHGGEGDDTFNEGTSSNGADTFNGGAGTDTVSYASRTGDITATIAGGAVSGENSETDTIAADVEAITGGSGDDTLTGDGNANTLNGGAGADTLVGGAGNDTLNGGAGNDTLRGGDGDDTINGDAGDDTIDEEALSNGADTFNCGAGTDLVSYASRTAAVTVTMDGVAGDGASSENDNVKTDCENLTGSNQGDTLTGNASANVITGGDGDDVMYGLGGDDVFDEGSAPNGADTFHGGAGTDRVDYSSRTGDLTVTMADATANDGESGETDNVSSDVENLDIGTGSTNTVTGNSLNNVINGNTGADTISGGAGNDTLYGAAGNDTLNGEAGDDLLDGGGGTNTLNGGDGSGDICYLGTATNCEL